MKFNPNLHFNSDAKSPSRSSRRKRIDRAFVVFCIVVASISVVTLVALLTSIFFQGYSGLTRTFLTGIPNPEAADSGIRPVLVGTIWICSICALFVLPIGIATAVLLVEYKPKTWILEKIHGFVQLNIANLSGVPSVVYGIIGLTLFVGMFQLFGTANDPKFEIGANYFDQFLSEDGENVLLVNVDGRKTAPTKVAPGMKAYTGMGEEVTIHIIDEGQAPPDDPYTRSIALRHDATAGRISFKSWYYFQLPLGRGVLAGSLTLMLVVLPIVIISSQEALRAVPDSLREASLGMGATKWQTTWFVTLPAALPGIMTGSILSMSRAIGEAAPVLIIAGIVFISFSPGHLMDDFSVLPLQIYNWAARPQEEFHRLAASGILVLLAILLSFNAVAVLIRHKMQKNLS